MTKRKVLVAYLGAGCSKISLWIHLRVVQFKTGDNVHGKVALFAHIGCCYSSPPLLVAANRAVPLQPATRS